MPEWWEKRSVTSRLYYEDGYLRSAEAEVVGVTDDGIILDRTVFYPEGGGQPGDRGTFGKWRIVNTVKGDDGDPVHVIEGEKPWVGERGMLSLDWNHRYFYMTEHSAQHLVSALLFSNHGIGTVAVHQGELYFTIETDSSAIDERTLLAVEDEANAAIRESHRIEQREMSHADAEALGMRRSIKVDGRVKVVFIEGLDAVACGGVHLASTGEIKEIQFCGSEKIRGHVRTIWKCGDLSVEYRRINRRLVAAAASMLSAEPESIPEAIERLEGDIASLKRSLKDTERHLAAAEFRSASKEAGEGVPLVFRTETDVQAFECIFDGDGEVPAAFIVDGNGHFMFHGTKEGFDALKSGLSLRGGGRGMLYRGSLTGDIGSALKEAKELLNG